MTNNNFAPGSEVRVKSDPGRRGIVTKADPIQQADYFKYRVQFPDGKFWVAEHEIELMDDDQSDPFALIKKGKYGRPEDLRRSLTHIQLSGRLANLVYSMDATNTDFYAYQYKPVLSLLESPTNGLLIADEVGLGKTIEAGLIWTELRARYDARRLVVLCPAMLREKWQAELSQRFGVDAEICSAEQLLRVLKADKHRTPNRKGYICSIQGIRPPRNWDNAKEPARSASAELARFLDKMEVEGDLIDLTIIDEAHSMRNPESQTAKLGSLIRSVSDHLVLLSATPINLRSEDLYHLLKLIDPDTFSNESLFPQVLEANEPIQAAYRYALDTRAPAQEIRTLLEKAKTHEVLSESSQLQHLLQANIEELIRDEPGRIELANKIARLNLLGHVVTRTRRVEVKEFCVIRQANPEFIELEEDGPERAFYDLVTYAIRKFAQVKGVSTGFLLATPQRQISSSMYAAAKSWRDSSHFDKEQLYEDIGVDYDDEGFLFDEEAPLLDFIRKNVLPKINIEQLREVDTKYKKLVSVLSEFFRKTPDEKVVIFTYFRGTVDYLFERLRQDGIESISLKGGQGYSKQEVINKFKEDKHIRVLVSTEVASEGVDLQFSRFLVNYDLPWNPMRVEQRIGRLDRIGQQADKIQIWNILHKGTIDERIYTRLLDRLKIFERALGGMEAILGEQISDLTADLLSKPLTEKEQQQRIAQTALAVENIRAAQDELESQASHLIAHGDYILRQVTAAHDLKRRITSEDLVAYVKDYLERSCVGHVFQNIDLGLHAYDIKLPSSAAARLEAFLRSSNLLGQTQLATGERVSCIFKNKVQLLGDRKEVISQFHPFVRFIASEIAESEEAFYPLAAMLLSRSETDLAPGDYVFVVDRWSFDGLRTEELLKFCAIKVPEISVQDAQLSWQLVNTCRLSGQPWGSAAGELSSTQVIDAVNKADEVLQSGYASEARQRESENQDRVSFQRLSAQRHRDRLLETNNRILETHRATNRGSLAKALEGKIQKVHERFDLRLAQIKERAKLTHNRAQICMGVIRIA